MEPPYRPNFRGFLVRMAESDRGFYMVQWMVASTLIATLAFIIAASITGCIITKAVLDKDKPAAPEPERKLERFENGNVTITYR